MRAARRVFYVVYLRDSRLQEALDAMRFIANPGEKNFAHITVRGPYHQRYNFRSVGKKINGTAVWADGVGSFFSQGQNTVFIRCYSEILRDVWRKADYGFNPHITIYDGPSRRFAEMLLERLDQLTLQFRFVVGGLSPLVSYSRQYSMELSQSFDEGVFAEVSGRRLRPSEVEGLAMEERVSLIEVFAGKLEGFACAGELGGVRVR